MHPENIDKKMLVRKPGDLVKPNFLFSMAQVKTTFYEI